MKLKPMLDHPEYWKPLEYEINEYFKRTIYLPLLRVITSDDLVENSMEDLVRAIQRGRIQFSRGRFEGRFDAVTSRELKKLGAEYDRTDGVWKLPAKDLTVDLRMAIVASESRLKRMHEKAQSILGAISVEGAELTLDIGKIFDDSINKMDRQFRENVKKVSVQPQLSKPQKDYITSEYTANTKIDIKGWRKWQIEELRKKVEKNVFEGGLRREALVEDIQEQYGVSERRARFIARQETNLLMATFQEKRYIDAGLPDYEWTCVNGSEEHPVRHWHRELNGKRCSWKRPPLLASKASCHRACHPGQDYNCRCTAIPVVR